MRNVTVGWFEIPVLDMERAVAFYETVFDCKLRRQQMGQIDMAWFPWDEAGKGAGGSLVKNDEFYLPSADGVQIYFSSEDVDTEIAKVGKAGGKVLSPKKEIAPDIGFMALFMDTEGNRISLHSNQ
jgi:predicted enzyme related to lactoylglutathione lyase